MNVGLHHLTDDYPIVLPAATFLDTAGGRVGMESPEKMCRIYFKGRPEPLAVAQKARAWHANGARVQLGNEPNLPLEGFGGTVPDYAAWFLGVANLCPAGVRLYYAGISPGDPNWRDWYVHPMAKSAIARAHGIVVHAYGTLEQIKEVVWWIYRQYPDKPLWLGEFNFGAGQKIDVDDWVKSTLRPLLDWLQTVPTLEAATYFAWTWPKPDTKLPTPVDAQGTEIERVIRSWKPQRPPTPKEPAPMMVDISNNNGPNVDLDALQAAGVVLVGMKASQGKSYADPTFPIYWQACSERDLARLAYFFWNPDDPDLGSTGDEDETSALFARQIERVGGLKDDDLIVGDFEAGNGNQLGRVARVLELVEDRCGVRPGKYSARWWTRAHGVESSELSKYWTWWANYEATIGPLPIGWELPLIWQTGTGPVPGLPGEFDLDTLLVPLADLQARGYRTGGDVIRLNDADKAAYLALTGQAWAAAEGIATILAKYGAEGQSAAEWVDQGIKAPVVLSKELTGTNR